MSRLVFGPLGLVMAAFPETVLERFEAVAVEDPEAAEVKSWVVPAMRVEGGLYLLAAVAGGRADALVRRLVAVFGALALAFPRQYLAVGSAIAYRDPDAVEWRPDFVAVVRVLGALAVLLAFVGRRADGGSEPASEDGATDGEPAT